MPIRRLTAGEAFGNLKTNAFSHWPRADEADNRFAHFAAPAFEPHFSLAPGQRIFTIGSCFARNIETALVSQGFDVPTRAFVVGQERTEASGRDDNDLAAVLNNYVPQAIAPQIRWAFGHEKFDLDRHCAEARPGRFIDLQVPMLGTPKPAATVLARRERLNGLYRKLADSHVVLITLGLVEAWWDAKSGGYINIAPPKSCIAAEPQRFELHVLDYAEVIESLRDLMRLLNEVCAKGWRMILTISPVPLLSTFTAADVAVANSYSKSVLRAAAEAIVAENDNVEYFPSYESVVLTDRSKAFIEDQVHVQGALVRFNVDRMIRRYVEGAIEETSAEIIARAREQARAGLQAAGLKTLQEAHAARPDDADLMLALAQFLNRAGQGRTAEALLLKLVETQASLEARIALTRFYNEAGRWAEAAEQAEAVSRIGRPSMALSLQRAVAYFHLERYAEGAALLATLRYGLEGRPDVGYWRARFAERLGRFDEAEALYVDVNKRLQDVDYLTAYAGFLAARGRWEEAGKLADEALLVSPVNATALKIRAESRRATGTGAATDRVVAAAPGLAAAATRLAVGLKARLKGRGE